LTRWCGEYPISTHGGLCICDRRCVVAEAGGNRTQVGTPAKRVAVESLSCREIPPPSNQSARRRVSTGGNMRSATDSSKQCRPPGRPADSAAAAAATSSTVRVCHSESANSFASERAAASPCYFCLPPGRSVSVAVHAFAPTVAACSANF